MPDTDGKAALELGDLGLLEPGRRTITKCFKRPAVLSLISTSTSKLMNSFTVATLREPNFDKQRNTYNKKRSVNKHS